MATGDPPDEDGAPTESGPAEGAPAVAPPPNADPPSSEGAQNSPAIDPADAAAPAQVAAPPGPAAAPADSTLPTAGAVAPPDAGAAASAAAVIAAPPAAAEAASAAAQAAAEAAAPAAIAAAPAAAAAAIAAAEAAAPAAAGAAAPAAAAAAAAGGGTDPPPITSINLSDPALDNDPQAVDRKLIKGKEQTVAAGGTFTVRPYDDGTKTVPYDENQSRDTTRQTITLWLIGLLCSIVALTFVALFARGASNGFTGAYFFYDLKQILDVLVGPVITLLASAVGFYFGSKQSDATDPKKGNSPGG